MRLIDADAHCGFRRNVQRGESNERMDLYRGHGRA